MTRWKAFGLAGGVGRVLFAAGLGLGFAMANATRGMLVTRAFMEERLAECGHMANLFGVAEERSHVRTLLGLELTPCGMLIDTWPHQIEPSDRELVARILAARAVAEAERQAAAEARNEVAEPADKPGSV